MPPLRTRLPQPWDTADDPRDEIALPLLPVFPQNPSVDFSPSSHSPSSSSASAITPIIPPTLPDFPAPSPVAQRRVSPTASSSGISSTDRKAQRSRARDPTWIPRPRNPFIIFRCDYTHEQTLIGTSSSSSDKTLSKRAAEAWSLLSPEQKEHYKQLAKREAEEHARLYPDYRFRPVRRPVSSAPRRGGAPTPIHDRQRRAKVVSLMMRGRHDSSSESPPGTSNLSHGDSTTPDYEAVASPPDEEQNRELAPPAHYMAQRRSSSVPLPEPHQAPGQLSLLSQDWPMTNDWRRQSFGLRRSRSAAGSREREYLPPQQQVPIEFPSPSRPLLLHSHSTDSSSTTTFSQNIPHFQSSTLLPLSVAAPFDHGFSFDQNPHTPSPADPRFTSSSSYTLESFAPHVLPPPSQSHPIATVPYRQQYPQQPPQPSPPLAVVSSSLAGWNGEQGWNGEPHSTPLIGSSSRYVFPESSLRFNPSFGSPPTDIMSHSAPAHFTQAAMSPGPPAMQHSMHAFSQPGFGAIGGSGFDHRQIPHTQELANYSLGLSTLELGFHPQPPPMQPPQQAQQQHQQLHPQPHGQTAVLNEDARSAAALLGLDFDFNDLFSGL